MEAEAHYDERTNTVTVVCQHIELGRLHPWTERPRTKEDRAAAIAYTAHIIVEFANRMLRSNTIRMLIGWPAGVPMWGDEGWDSFEFLTLEDTP